MAPLVTASVTNPILGNGPIQQRIIRTWGIVGNSRRELASDAVTTDEFEVWFDKGVTDGLPVVPPTRERVERMLSGTRRSPGELLGEMPPNYGRLTIEKAAINAVLAGCRPEYLPVVIAASECACDPAFNLHGVSTPTHFSASLIVVNGPIRGRIGLNSGFGVFGPATARTRRSAVRCGC
jgi:hypothetical protein